jgi:hypothetical protein
VHGAAVLAIQGLEAGCWCASCRLIMQRTAAHVNEMCKHPHSSLC